MARTDATGPASSAASAADRATAGPQTADKQQRELPTYDASKLVMSKSGKAVPPVKPDDTERNLQLEKLTAEVKRMGDRIAAIKAVKVAKTTPRAVPPEVAEHKQKKQALQAQWSTELKNKARVREESQRANTEREVLRNDLREERTKLPRGVRQLDTLEADIQALEFKLQHESLSPADEKAAHARIAALSAARPVAARITALEAKLKGVDAARAAAKKRLDECNELLEAIKAKEREEVAAIDALWNKQREGEETVDLAALEVEKQECWEIMQALRTRAAEVRAEFDARWKVYVELNRNYNAWKRNDDHRQYLERQAAREARQAAREQQGAERQSQDGSDAEARVAAATTAYQEKLDAEIFRVDQLLAHLRKFQGTTEQGPVSGESKAVEVPQGLKPFARKDDDFTFFTAVEKKAKTGKPAGVKRDAKAAAKAAAPKGRLNHNLDILQLFMALGVDVPHSATELPSTTAQVEAKKAELVDKRKNGKPPVVVVALPEVQVLSAEGDVIDQAHKHKPEDEAQPEDGPSSARSSSSGVSVSLAVDETARAVALRVELAA